MASSPTKRSLALLREQGYLAEVVEKWNAHARVRQDLFGIVDILAVRDGETLAVQTTSASNVSKRVQKIAESEAAAVLRKAGWRLHVHGWSKNKTQRKWVCRVVDVS